MATSKKDMKALIKSAEKQGWRVTENKGHYKWFAPDGKTIIVCGSSESGRTANHIARLRGTGMFVL